MMRMFAIGLALFAPAPTWALSCVGESSIASNYTFAAESESDFIIAIGRLANSGPRQTIDDQGSYSQMTRFEGEVLIGEAFAPGWSADVEVFGWCYGGGCGTHPVDREGLFFFERVDGRLEYVAGGCGGMVHLDPTRADMDAVIQCYLGQCN